MIPGNVRIFLCAQPVDMRRSFDGLAQAARELLGKDPNAGGLFVFCGKNHRRLKVLWLDGHGYCLLYKRLHGARFVLPRRDGDVPASLDVQELAVLLQGVKLDELRRRLH
jgi:transposase